MFVCAQPARYHLTPKSAPIKEDGNLSEGKRLSARVRPRDDKRDTCAHIGRIIIKNRAARIASQPACTHASLGPQRNVNKTHASSVKIPDACLSKSEKEMSNLTNYTSPQHASTKGAERSSLAQKIRTRTMLSREKGKVEVAAARRNFQPTPLAKE
jgi:hypothetical protein